MPASKRTTMIDGYTSVQMVRRAAGRSQGALEGPDAPPPTQQPKEGPEPPAPGQGKVGTKVSRTAVPERHDIICYECQYAFVLTGRLRATICPKCHEPLEATPLVVAEEHTGPVRTIGTAHVKPGGVLKDAEIVARIAIIEGDARDGTIRCQQLLYGSGGRINLARTTFRELVVAEGAEFKIDEPVTCRSVEVKGTMDAAVLTGLLTVRAGGLVRGTVQAGRLVVDEGGGLVAKLLVRRDIEVEHKDQTPRKK